MAGVAAGILSGGIALAATPAAGYDPEALMTNGLPGHPDISPGLLDLKAKPGDLLNIQIRVHNGTGKELLAHVSAEDVGAGPAGGDLPLMLLHETVATRHSLKDWIGPLAALDIRPGDVAVVNASIQVPANAPPGSHMGAIRFVSAPPGESNQPKPASVGTLVFLNVQGAAREQLVISNFGSGRIGSDSRFYNTSLLAGFPVAFAAVLRNAGDVQLQPKGTLTVSDTFGRIVSRQVVSTDGDILLPGGADAVSQVVSGRHAWGLYSASLELPYSNTQKLVAKTSFWVMPAWITVGLLLTLVGCLYLALRWLLRARSRS